MNCEFAMGSASYLRVKSESETWFTSLFHAAGASI